MQYVLLLVLLVVISYTAIRIHRNAKTYENRTIQELRAKRTELQRELTKAQQNSIMYQQFGDEEKTTEWAKIAHQMEAKLQVVEATIKRRESYH